MQHPRGNSSWSGERVRLRAVEPDDWPIHYEWNKDSEAARRGYWIPFPQSRESVRRWAEREATAEPQNDRFQFQIENLAGELVGTTNTTQCDLRNGTFSYGIMVRPEHQRKGYASEAIVLLLRYFFAELRYQKVFAGVYDFNEPSIGLHRRLGFQLEGRLRRKIYTGGSFHDELVFGMTAEEFAEQHAHYWSRALLDHEPAGS